MYLLNFNALNGVLAHVFVVQVSARMSSTQLTLPPPQQVAGAGASEAYAVPKAPWFYETGCSSSSAVLLQMVVLIA
jgi:hypothetical protein